MITSYTLNIMMEAQTVAALRASGYTLYGFKAVSTTASGGMPTVWFDDTQYLQSTDIVWLGDCQAYASHTPVQQNAVVMETTALDINLGQMLVIDANGNGTVKTGASQNAISLLNQAPQPLTTGISEEVNGVVTPICALPIFPNMLETVTPEEKILLMFSTQHLNSGTMVEKAASAGILVDLTVASCRSVSFDINTGWDAGDASWAQSVPANTNIAGLLIEDSSYPQIAASS